mmetsp:Transcript_45712/g.107747  ORF Transcript_45712/g.107747 Transcript_45712/m.107747 type:complete len:285 (+) Transcript_45712:137-991(+)
MSCARSRSTNVLPSVLFAPTSAGVLIASSSCIAVASWPASQARCREFFPPGRSGTTEAGLTPAARRIATTSVNPRAAASARAGRATASVIQHVRSSLPTSAASPHVAAERIWRERHAVSSRALEFRTIAVCCLNAVARRSGSSSISTPPVGNRHSLMPVARFTLNSRPPSHTCPSGSSSCQKSAGRKYGRPPVLVPYRSLLAAFSKKFAEVTNPPPSPCIAPGRSARRGSDSGVFDQVVVSVSVSGARTSSLPTPALPARQNAGAACDVENTSKRSSGCPRMQV